MKKVPLVPRPTSWLGAIFLYFFLGLYGAAAAVIIPRLVEIGEDSPRLAALGYLALLVAPIPSVGLAHHVVTLVLDRADSSSKPVLPGLAALWSGVYAWFVMFFSLIVAALLQYVLFPPESASAVMVLRSFTWPYASAGSLGLHTFLWVGLAAQLYDLERSVRERAKKGEL